ncbi:MAG TPA: sialidase family protein [Phototrophicaceae bacterium]|nr:sialidase family protein [Phototrophicaceae bacterium]
MIQRIRLLPIIALLLVTTVIPVPAAAQRQFGNNWSPPELLGDGWWQSVAMDQEGQFHVGWFGSLTEEVNGVKISHDVLSYIRRSPDGIWSKLNDAIYTGDGGYTVRNSLDVTSDGSLYAVFRQNTYHAIAHAPARAADNASNWSSPITLNNGGYYLDFMIDKDDILHFVYSGGLGILNRGGDISSIELSPCAACNDLFYLRSADGGKTWSTPYPLSLEAESGADRINIFQAPSGRIYIDWDEGYDWYAGRGTPQDVRLAYSDDGGLTWSDPIVLDGGNRDELRPIQIAAIELLDESLLAVWRYSNDTDRQIYYQTSPDQGVTWTEAEPIPGIFARSNLDTPLDDYELVLNRQGYVSLFAVGYTNNTDRLLNAGLYQIQYNQGIWQPPLRIFYSPEERPEWPQAAVGPTNDLHVTFFTRDKREDGNKRLMDNHLRVYYSHLPGNLPAEIQEFTPTQTPLPTPTLVQKLEATPTPFPTIEKISDPVGPTTADTYASQTLMGGLIAAGIFCVLVVVGLRFVRRE